jgi:1-acyl-sn-glycerol-3-phosphate acyltransferase
MARTHGSENVGQGQILYALGHTPWTDVMSFLDFTQSAAGEDPDFGS